MLLTRFQSFKILWLIKLSHNFSVNVIEFLHMTCDICRKNDARLRLCHTRTFEQHGFWVVKVIDTQV